MPRLSKIGAAALAAFGWTSGVSTVSASYLVVAGGGGGGRQGGTNTGSAAGGGAGGFRTGTLSLDPTLSYTVTVGAGGSGSTTNDTNGSAGGSSTLSTITSAGGGGGGGAYASAGSSGGSGGGSGQGGTTGGSGNTPSTSPSQGNNGGNSGGVNYNVAAGGGGAGAVGSNATSTNVGGAGGAGSASSISGSSVTYAGGGGAGTYGGGTIGAGGSGGGASGGASSGGAGGTGTANLGGGGGGGGGGAAGVAGGNGGSGGSGVVIISYAGAQQFGGGVVTSSGGNTIHTFTTSGTLVPITPLSANYLIVAGGGGGGKHQAGGGGAGGYLTGSGLILDTNSIYTVTVGAGGAGTSTGNTSGANGTNSLFSGYTTTAIGGGGGSYYNSGAGLNGGSGGGAGGHPSAAQNGGTATSGQGFNGGKGNSTAQGGGGGGGGASAVGVDGVTTVGGAGGAGAASSISGSSVTYAGGGGGGGVTPGAAGAGGGGAGTKSGTAGSGTANTGGGGGGEGDNAGTSGNGGSGVVIISYAGATQLMAGGTVTISGGNVIHTFTSSGYLTPIKYVGNSLRFRSSASAYLSRTPSAVGSRTTWTYSCWVKRGRLGADQALISAYTGTATINTQCSFMAADDTLDFYDNNGSYVFRLITTQAFRDPAAWYHIVLVLDTTQATASNRVKIYVNGTQITSFSTATYPPLNDATSDWNSNTEQRIGRHATNYFDGYFAEINNIDGQALTPNSFGTINSYGVWQPITYGGSYGTNGFYLPFTNKTSTTTLGYDFSPNGNNWTTNNISLTTGATYDSMTDVPTLTSATAANYSVANPLSTLFTVTAGNMDFTYTNSTSGVWYLKGTLAVSSDKYYWEVTPTNVGAGSNISIGIILSSNTQTNTTTINLVTDGYVYHCDGNKYSGAGGATGVAYGATYTNNDVIGVALDLTAGTLVFYKNNVSQGTAFTGLTSSYMQLICNHLGGTSRTVAGSVNAGQRPFTYTPPSGFVALNTFNL